MTLAASIPRTMLATWSRRVALFSATLIVIALVLHRLGVIETPLGMGLVLTGLAGAVVAILAGIAAVVVIWRKGVAGSWSAVAGIVLSLAICAWPASVVPLYLKMSHLNDVTTDTEHPPEFDTLSQERPKGANSIVYPGATYATRQSQIFPQIQPMVLTRSPDEVFDAVGEAARRLRWHIVAEEPPGTNDDGGHLEAVDRTLILGFADDIVVRVESDSGQTRVDVRSKSRYGVADFGRNAQRVKDFYTELHARLEASVPSTVSSRGKPKARGTKMPARSRKDARGSKAGLRSGQDSARPDARRAPPPKGTPPSRAGDRSRDR